MDMKWLSLSILFLLVSMMCALVKTPTPEPTTGTISGKVIDSGDGSPVPAANISTDPPASSVTADARGSYSIRKVPPGNYVVTATKPGYTSVSVRIALVAGETTTADLHLTAVATNSLHSPAVELTEGLVAYYPFNGNSDDESGNRNHGTVYGATLTSDRFGNRESAYYFDGIDDRIDVEDSSRLDFGTGDFSISGWFKTTYVHNDPNGACLLDKYPQHGKPWTIRLHVDGRLRFLCDESAYSNATVNDGRWHHFVAVRFESTIKLFLDGELQETASSTSSASNSRPLCFGCVRSLSGGVARLFQGALDDIRIYDRALSETEVQILYNERE
jgi:hypothetical protein